MAKKCEKIDDKKIEEVVEFLSTSCLSEIEIKEGKFKIRAKKACARKKLQVNSEYTQNKKEEHSYKKIISPLTGTVYRAPFPGATSFVEEGSLVEKGQTVAIVEAMKLFNEIKSEFEGKIVKVLIKDNQLVEAEQILFLVE